MLISFIVPHIFCYRNLNVNKHLERKCPKFTICTDKGISESPQSNTFIKWIVFFVCSHVQQVRKGLLSLVVRTSLRLGTLCGPTPLCRSRSLSSTTDMARDNTDLGNYNYLNNNCSNTLSLSGPSANRDRIIMEMVLQKGQALASLSARHSRTTAEMLLSKAPHP